MNIALLGAESSGKSQLAQALVQELQALLPSPGHGGPTVALVPEALRSWCVAHGRTPLAHEQASVAELQLAALHAAQADGGPGAWVVSDTTPLQTAVYSEHYFSDTSLTAWAHHAHRQHHAPGQGLTLLMGLDLPWQADGPWRDGPAVQQAIDALLRTHLQQLGLPFQTIYGHGTHRVGAALQAVAAALPTALHAAQTSWKDSLVTRANYLLQTSDRVLFHSKMMPACEACSDPDCEHTLFTRLLSQRPTRPVSARLVPPAEKPAAG